ncbi:hypothetical protein M011DRAFT_470764 [Sporormia fimetaria CBS 119925]|uniref:Radical SAM core domain-containing protein n=1 Tax=Sporormia fimetaria CBS 119925 TaxID=1340428 RepID=A0A6A6V459_9PLEO|nr:hypothetical protein M011DRAFT_470764 [Sporormia fimetaria CBS 119925]
MAPMLSVRPAEIAMYSALRRASSSGKVPWRPSLRSYATAGLAIREPLSEEPFKDPQPRSVQGRKEAIRNAKPFSDFLMDTFNRQHDYLRISVTERCNLRCLYCMPEEGVPLSPPAHLLTSPEIFYLSSLFVSQGVTKIRLTGGEPTVRRDIVPLMQSIGTLRAKGLRELALTTNGITLFRKLDSMVEAGLTGVNLSLDTLDPFQFQIMTRRKGFDNVMKCIDRILEMNRLGANVKLKVNCVVMRGLNEREIIPFVELGREKDIEVRFIEYMPFGGNKWSEGKMFSYREMLDVIRTKYPDLRRVPGHKNDTSKTFEVPGFVGKVGFITSMTNDFCGTCNRLRITGDGNLKVCLHGNAEVSLRDLLRQDNGGQPIDEEAFQRIKQIELDRRDGRLSDETILGWGDREKQLLNVIGAAVKRKAEKHADIGDLEKMENRPMILIGDTMPKSPYTALSDHDTPVFTTFLPLSSSGPRHYSPAIHNPFSSGGSSLIRAFSTSRTLAFAPLPWETRGKEVWSARAKKAAVKKPRNAADRAEQRDDKRRDLYDKMILRLTREGTVTYAEKAVARARSWDQAGPFGINLDELSTSEAGAAQEADPRAQEDTRVRAVIKAINRVLKPLEAQARVAELLPWYQHPGTWESFCDHPATAELPRPEKRELWRRRTKAATAIRMIQEFEKKHPATKFEDAAREGANLEESVVQDPKVRTPAKKANKYASELRTCQRQDMQEREEVVQYLPQFKWYLKQFEERRDTAADEDLSMGLKNPNGSREERKALSLERKKLAHLLNQPPAPLHPEDSSVPMKAHGQQLKPSAHRVNQSEDTSTGQKDRVPDKGNSAVIETSAARPNKVTPSSSKPTQELDSAQQPQKVSVNESSKAHPEKALPSSSEPSGEFDQGATPKKASADSWPFGPAPPAAEIPRKVSNHPSNTDRPSAKEASSSPVSNREPPKQQKQSSPIYPEDLRLQRNTGVQTFDGGLTLNFDSNIDELQSQVYQLYHRLSTSFPRIDTLPYAVWKSDSRTVLQMWLRILAKKWETRFDSVTYDVDDLLAVVLDEMVRAHELDHNASQRMAKRFSEVFERRGKMESGRGEQLDWDEFDAEMGWLKDESSASSRDTMPRAQASTPQEIEPRDTGVQPFPWTDNRLIRKYQSFGSGRETDLNPFAARKDTGTLRFIRKHAVRDPSSETENAGAQPSPRTIKRPTNSPKGRFSIYRSANKPGQRWGSERHFSTSARTLQTDERIDTSLAEYPNHPEVKPTTSIPAQTHLPHLTPSGSAHMVSVSDKPSTVRTAIAIGVVNFSNPTPLSLIRSNSLKKGDVLSVARIAGIMAAKQCPTLIPLCHPIALSHVGVTLKLVDADEQKHGGVEVQAKAQCVGPTGVEMEALTAVMGAALTVVDMCKAVDKAMRVEGVRVVRKEGGRSGTWCEEGW